MAFFPVIDAIQEFKIESNSPPAEFGRFNGGVVNLTTKSGDEQVARHGLRVLPQRGAERAQLLLSRPNPVKPEFRRNQFGGMIGGPVAQDRTFFFVDYQGQRQTIGRTVISTVPTRAAAPGRSSPSRSAAACRVIYDPATTDGRHRTRTPFAGNTIPTERDGSGRAGAAAAVSAADIGRHGEQLPPDGQRSRQPGSVRRARSIIEFAQRAIRCSGGCRTSATAFVPVTPLARRQRRHRRHAAGPQDTTAWSFAVELSAHVLAIAAERAARRRHAPRGRPDARRQLATAAGAALNIPGIPSTRAVSEHAADVPDHRLPAARLAAEHGDRLQHQRDRDRRFADVAEGAHTLKMGARLALGAAERRPAAVADRARSPSAISSPICPASPNTGTPLASFLLGQVQTFSIDLQQTQIQESRALPGVLHPGRLAGVGRLTLNAGPALHAEFPVDRGQQPGRGLQPADAAARVPRPRRQPDVGARAAQERTSARASAWPAASPTRPSSAPATALVCIEKAGITTPFTTPVVSVPPDRVAADARQHHAGVRAGERTDRRADRARRPTPGSARACSPSTRDLGSGYVQQWNVSVQRELTTNTSVEVAYVGSKITHVGMPDTNINQLTVDQLALGPGAAGSACPIRTSASSRARRRSAIPTITRRAADEAVPEYTAVSLYRNNVGDDELQGRDAQAGAAALARAVVSR